MEEDVIELSTEAEKLWNQHEKVYDDFENYIHRLRNMRLIDDHHVRMILEKADDVVETHGRYNFEFGKKWAFRWFNPQYWRGLRQFRESAKTRELAAITKE